ncbi:MAG: PaaI family thioesterase [Gammaproteobacteria bacterium]|nr:PaaI family thioesterase [Gammaproteobacteria bacterium]
MSDAELGGVIKRLENFEPFKMMQVKILELTPDWRSIKLLLPLSGSSINHQGTMFGGFMASLSDPVAALSCGKLFPDYAAWTRKLTIDFLRAGTTDLVLHFDFPSELEPIIAKELEEKGRSTPTFTYAYYLKDGTLCAEVNCSVAIRPQGYMKK